MSGRFFREPPSNQLFPLQQRAIKGIGKFDDKVLAPENDNRDGSLSKNLL